MIYNDISVYLDMYIICTVFIYIYIYYLFPELSVNSESPLSVGFVRIGIYGPAFEHARHCVFPHNNITGLSLIE